MPSKARKPQKKVKLGSATASEIVSSLRITRREMRLAAAAVAAVMGNEKGGRASRKPTTRFLK